MYPLSQVCFWFGFPIDFTCQVYPLATEGKVIMLFLPFSNCAAALCLADNLMVGTLCPNARINLILQVWLIEPQDGHFLCLVILTVSVNPNAVPRIPFCL